MSGRVKKRRDKLAKKALEGKLTVPEAQRRAGGKYARKAAQADLVKMQQAQATARDQAAQVAGAVREAFAGALKSAQPPTADAPRAENPPAQPRHWTGTDLELRNRADFHPDPHEREAARQILVGKGMLPGTPVSRETTRTSRAIVWAPGPDGTFGWRAVPESQPLDFGIAPPGTTGR